MKRISAIIAIVSLLLLVSSASAGHGAAQNTLTVRVINETVNGTPVAGDSVIVHIYDHGEPVKTFEEKVGPDGVVVFEDLPTGDKVAAVSRAKHKDMMFTGNTVALLPTKSEFAATIPVYDVSTDKSHLSIQTHHIMVKVAGETLIFTEYMQLVNSSSMAVSSGQAKAGNAEAVIEIKLPGGFKNLQSQSYFEQQALVITDEGFYDTMAVPPGEYQIAFTYTLDIDSETIDIAKPITLPTSKIVMFTDLGSARIEGLAQPANTAKSADGKDVKYYAIADVPVGGQIEFKIAGFTPKGKKMPTWIIFAGIFAVVMVLVVLRMRPSRN